MDTTGVMQITHYYKMDPVTGQQAQDPTYIEPINVRLSDVMLVTVPPRSSGALQRRTAKKRKSEDGSDDDSDGEYTGAAIGKPKKKSRTKSKKKRLPMPLDDFEDIEYKPVASLPSSYRPRWKPFSIEIPTRGTVDRSHYKPISDDVREMLDNTLPPRRARLNSKVLYESLPSSRPSSPGSVSDDGSSHKAHTCRKPNVKKEPTTPRRVKRNPDEGLACHQCRNQKIQKRTMRCRHVNHTGRMCTLNYCERCIFVRYGEDFNPDDKTWRCPRCFGNCNCSICLRKIGLDYILDDPKFRSEVSALVLARSVILKTGKPNAEAIDVRTFLQQRGIITGNEEWMDASTKKGVLYYIGQQLSEEERTQYKPAYESLYLRELGEGGEIEAAVEDTALQQADDEAPTSKEPAPLRKRMRRYIGLPPADVKVRRRVAPSSKKKQPHSHANGLDPKHDHYSARKTSSMCVLESSPTSDSSKQPDSTTPTDELRMPALTFPTPESIYPVSSQGEGPNTFCATLPPREPVLVPGDSYPSKDSWFEYTSAELWDSVQIPVPPGPLPVYEDPYQCTNAIGHLPLRQQYPLRIGRELRVGCDLDVMLYEGQANSDDPIWEDIARSVETMPGPSGSIATSNSTPCRL